MIVRELIHRLGFDVDDSQLRRFNRTLKVTENNIQGALSGVENLSRRMRNLGAGFTAFVSAPLALLGFQAVKTASDFQQMDIAFQTLLGSEEKAKVLTKEILALTKETPFQLKDTILGATRLLAFNIEAEKVIPTLRMLGDIASAVGTERLPNLILALGQVKTAGVLRGQERRQFTEAGVALPALLAESLGVDIKEIEPLTRRGKISFEQVEKAIIKATSEGGKFFNLMKKQSKTTAGRFSNLIDTITIAGAVLGKEIIRVLRLNKVITVMSEIIERAEQRFKKFNPPIKTAIVLLGAFLVVIGPVILALGALGLSIVSIAVAVAIFQAVILPILPMILAVAAALALAGIAFTLLADDIFIWATGGDSVIGKFLGKFDIFKDRVLKGLRLMRDLFIGFWQGVNSGDFTLFEAKIKELAPFVLKAIGAILKELFVRIPLAISNIQNLITKAIIKSFASMFIFLVKGFSNLNTFSQKALKKLIVKGAQLLFGSTFGKTIVKLLGIDLDKPKEGAEKRAAEIGTGTPGTERFLGQKPIAKPQPLQFGSLFPKIGSVTTNQINVDSKIEITVPPGTSAENAEFIKKDVGVVFEEKLSGMLTEAMDTIQKSE